MGSIEDNLRYFQASTWDQGGEEWSRPWGSSEALWTATILPRIGAWLDREHLLEIAVGYGRVTRFLVERCRRFTGVDLAPRCVDACRGRFAGVGHARFHLTDGRSLPEVADSSVDFAFSWDSLVHCDEATVRGYLAELGRTLRPDGVAFLHHSNVEAYRDPVTGELPGPNEHDRGPDVSARTVRAWAPTHGLACTSQEIVAFPGEHLTDCFSVLVPARGPDATGAPPSLVVNREFLAEAASARARGAPDSPPP